jgi:VWFA-related protein
MLLPMKTAFTVLLAASLGFAQKAPPAPPAATDQDQVIKVDVDLVNLYFSVRDKSGTYLSNLTKDDFTVYEDGKEQTPKFFAREINQPLTIGLLVDVSRSQEALIDSEREASYEFFKKVLRPKDMAFIISFGADSELLQDFTNSSTLLYRALKGLRLNAGTGGIGPTPSTINLPPRGTVLYDAVYLAANEKMRTEVGRKALVVITDGDDYGSRLKIQQAIEEAQRADSIIYAVMYEDPRFTDPALNGVSGEGPMRKMSEETGGRMFRVDRKTTLQQIYDTIQQEMRSQYTIGYTPTNQAKDGTFRKIEVKTKNKDVKVQVRRGYYAGKG